LTEERTRREGEVREESERYPIGPLIPVIEKRASNFHTEEDAAHRAATSIPMQATPKMPMVIAPASSIARTASEFVSSESTPDRDFAPGGNVPQR